VPFGKLAKGAKYLGKFADDAFGAGRKYGDDLATGARKYGDGAVGVGRRSADDFAQAAGKAGARDLAQSAARSAAQAAAARRAAQEAVTRQAQAAIAWVAKNNPLPVLAAALRPRIALRDVVSSSEVVLGDLIAAMGSVGGLVERLATGGSPWSLCPGRPIRRSSSRC
jgi:hypothetical protein